MSGENTGLSVRVLIFKTVLLCAYDNKRSGYTAYGDGRLIIAKMACLCEPPGFVRKSYYFYLTSFPFVGVLKKENKYKLRFQQSH